MNEPIIRRTFQFTDLACNNNKFWTVEYWENGTMTTTWGRVGQSPQTKTKQQVETPEIDRLIREKERKGYVEIQLHAPTPTYTAPAASLDPRLQNLLDLITREAITRIEGYLAVDIHTLSQTQIDKGRTLLKQIQGARKRLGHADGREQVTNWVQEYYNSIPTKLPPRIDRNQVIAEFVLHLSEQEDRLNQLEAGLAANQATATGSSPLDALGGVTIIPLESSDTTYEQIADYIARTSGGRRRIHHVYSIHIPPERTAWKAEKRGKHNIVSLFHGTKSWNLRHILKTGLIVPQIAANGSRMGRGIYFADFARRSLNYTGGNVLPLHVLFVADVALGTPIKMDGIAPHLKAAPDGYDSVWGINSWSGDDEFIVYKTSQQTIRALVTLE